MVKYGNYGNSLISGINSIVFTLSIIKLQHCEYEQSTLISACV